MDSLLNLLLILIAILHFLFLVLEMFLWSKPSGRKLLGMKQEYAELTKTLAANQGLYNGFLAAGLVWGVLSGLFSVQLFFLSCVFIAGIYGALSVSKSIFWIQALPAIVALIVLTLVT